MGTLLALVLVFGLIAAVFRRLASGESDEDPHLTVRLRARIKRLERYRHLPEPVFGMSAPEFGEYIAGLCRRDGCTDVQRVTGDTLGGQLTGRLPDGRKVAVTCNRECGDRPVDLRCIRSFDDAARARLGAAVTVLVVLGPVGERERRTAARRGLTLIDVDRLGSWMTGTPLSALPAPGSGRSDDNRASADD